MGKLKRRVVLRCVFLLSIICFCANYFGVIRNILGITHISLLSTSPFSLIDQSNASSYLLDRLDIDCAGILSKNQSIIDFYRPLRYDSNSVEKEIIDSEDRCSAIKSRFQFHFSPLSKEEEEYPLAYGLIVYNNVTQVLFMLSSFYHPQNVYCIAVSENAEAEFHIIMRELEGCLPNVHVIPVKKIEWGSYEVLSALYQCFNYLTQMKHKWKYFQYLSGVDVPLKTNLEMVRIFKALNETMNFEIAPYQTERLWDKNETEPPLKLFKSSMSALVPRAAAEIIVKSEKVSALLKFLNGTDTPDEAFWATVGGNPDSVPLGQLDAGKLLALQEKMSGISAVTRKGVENATSFPPDYCSFRSPCRDYISRFQVWSGGECNGKFIDLSCVFGIGDLPTLLNRPELVAHKLYIDYEPAAFFCALKSVNHRALHPIYFDASEYTRIPSVELKSGKTVEQLTYPEKMFGDLFPN